MKTLALRKNLFEHLPVVCISLILLGVAAPLLLYYRHASKPPDPEPPGAAHFPSPAPGHEIHGFRYEGHFNGKKSISIAADRLRVQKKKIGHFRFGLLNDALFDNARVHIYGHSKEPPDNPPHDRTDKPDAAGADLPMPQSAGTGLSFEGIFSAQGLPALPVKRISSIIMNPVAMTLHDETGEISRIEASSAAIRWANKDMLFSGNVRVRAVNRAGYRVLNANRLKLLPDRAIMITEGAYTLRTAQKQVQGRDLTADVRLNPVSVAPRGGGTFDGEGDPP